MPSSRWRTTRSRRSSVASGDAARGAAGDRDPGRARPGRSARRPDRIPRAGGLLSAAAGSAVVPRAMRRSTRTTARFFGRRLRTTTRARGSPKRPSQSHAGTSGRSHPPRKPWFPSDNHPLNPATTLHIHPHESPKSPNSYPEQAFHDVHRPAASADPTPMSSGDDSSTTNPIESDSMS